MLSNSASNEDERRTNALAREAGKLLLARRESVTTAESCTAGGICSAITEIPGSSSWFDRAFIVYSEKAKHECLGVSFETIKNNGVVSEAVAFEMAKGALERSPSQWAISITGFAGPGGGDGLAQGTVVIGWGDQSQGSTNIQTHVFHFEGDRQAVRQQAIDEALNGLIRRLKA